MYKFEAEKAVRNVGEEFIIIERNSDLFSSPPSRIIHQICLSFFIIIIIIIVKSVSLNGWYNQDDAYFRSGYSKSKNLKYENLRV